jgi:hypothetical protein
MFLAATERELFHCLVQLSCVNVCHNSMATTCDTLADVGITFVNLGQFSLLHPLASWDVIHGMIMCHHT